MNDTKPEIWKRFQLVAGVGSVGPEHGCSRNTRRLGGVASRWADTCLQVCKHNFQNTPTPEFRLETLQHLSVFCSSPERGRIKGGGPPRWFSRTDPLSFNAAWVDAATSCSPPVLKSCFCPRFRCSGSPLDFHSLGKLADAIPVRKSISRRRGFISTVHGSGSKSGSGDQGELWWGGRGGHP